MKKLDVTPAIAAMLARVADGIDHSKISIYEARAINTLPVRKQGLFNGARLTEATINEMAAHVSGGNSHPLHQLHDQSYSLPVGKVFHSERIDNEGVPEVRILFYVDNSETELVSKLESSSIDEVSIGFQAKHMLCSECGWDYMSAEATMDNFWEMTCANEHTIGTEGVHLSLSGLGAWYETSLVSIGAAQGAKILGRTKALIGQEAYNRLAASGISPDMRILFASSTPVTPPTPENQMDPKDFILDLSAKASKIALLELAETRHASTVTELNGKITALDADKLKLSADLTKATADLVAAQTKITELSGIDGAKAAADLAIARGALFARATKVAVMSGNEKPAENATLDVLLSSIAASELKLAELPLGGRSNVTSTGSGAQDLAIVQYQGTAASFETK